MPTPQLTILEPTAGTDPDDVRPYMKRIMQFAPADVDFIEGKSSIGQMNIEVVDKRTNPNDQNTGWFTAILSDADGNNQLTGRRILIEQQAEDGSWYTLMNGVIGDITLADNKVTYKMAVRDARERERKIPIFNAIDGDWSLMPLGLTRDFGAIHGQASRPLIRGVRGYRAKYYRDTANSKAGLALVSDFNGYPRPSNDYIRKIAYAHWANPYAQPGIVSNENPITEQYYSNAGIRWRPWSPFNSTYEWTEILAVPMYTNTAFTNFTQILLYGYGPRGQRADGHKDSNRDAISFVINSTDETQLPVDGQDIEVQLVYTGPLTEEYPLFIEESFGTLLKKLYDGDYSQTDPKIDYDEDAVNLMAVATPLARLRVTKSEPDLRDWVQKNIYKPLGYAPVLSSDGRITPTKYALPSVDADLVELNDSNCRDATWMHSYKDVANKVIFKYKRQEVVDDPEQILGVDIEERDVEYVAVHASAALFGPKPIEYEPDTVRSWLRASANGSVPNAMDELGTQLALLRKTEIFDRYVYGAQRVKVNAFRSDPDVASLNIGDWVLLGHSYLPDYGTGERGMSRIGQIVRIQDMDPLVRELEIVDGGPNVQPLSAPTISTVAYALGRVEVTFASIPTGAEGRVDYAIADEEPDPSSGDWIFAGRTSSIATPVYTPPVPNDVIVWIRGRSEAQGKRPSAHTNVESITINAVPLVEDLSLEIADGSNPIVRWNGETTTAGGLRIHYQQFFDGEDLIDVPSFVDIEADEGELELPITLHQTENLLVAVEPWTAYSGSAVAGTAGSRIMLRGKRLSRTFIGPAFQEDRDQDATDATLVIVPNDPQFRISSVEFRTKEGTAAWSSWVEDTSVPYSATVPLVAGGTSLIEYRVNVIHDDGTESIMAAAQVAYVSAGVTGFVECRARMTAATATSITVTVDGISPDGGTVEVQLVQVTGSAALTSGASPGTLVASGSSWTFSRGAALGGSGQTQFRAVQTGFQTDDDFCEIPEQGRDTFALQITATVTDVESGELTVRVTCNDPISQGGTAYITLDVAGFGVGTITPSSAQSVANGGFVDYVIQKPSFSDGQGRVVFTATAANRVADTDAVDIPPGEGSINLAISAEVVQFDAQKIKVRVKTVDPQPSPTSGAYTIEHTNNYGGSVSPASGGNNGGFATADFATTAYRDYIVDRPVAGTTESGTITFTAYSIEDQGPRTPASASVLVAPAVTGGPELQWQSGYDGGPTADGDGVESDWVATNTPVGATFNHIVVRDDTVDETITHTGVTDPDTVADTEFAEWDGANQIGTAEVRMLSSGGGVLAKIYNNYSYAPQEVTSIDVSNVSSPCDGGGSVDVEWTHINLPSGGTFNVLVTILTGTYTGQFVSATGVTSPHTLSPAFCPGEQYRVKVTMKDSGGTDIHFLEEDFTS